MDSMDFNQLSAQVPGWMQEAGKLVTQTMRQGFHSRLKEDATPVTEIDHAVETYLRQQIMQYYPDHGIHGEEEGIYQPEASYRWTIDPIDGTRALMAGFPTFTILLALAEKGQPRFGAAYQPITVELWMGNRQQPSTLNRNPISTRPCPALAEAFFSTTSPLLFSPKQRKIIEMIMQQCRAYQLGGDGYAYAKLASGHIDLILESGLKPYDFMALAPIIEGAGGIITDWAGQPLHLDSDGTICAAGDKRLHAQILPLLK